MDKDINAIIYRGCCRIRPHKKEICWEIPTEVIQMISGDKNHGLGVVIIPRCPNEENCEYKED